MSEESSRTANNEADKVIIGIDFGTSYSGIAYVLTVKPSDVYVVKEWPGAKGITYDKCPTLLKYEQDGSIRWGFELDRATKGRIEAIKLLLDPEQPTPIYVPAVDTEAELKRLGKSPLTVATDYIRAIFEHATSKIESKYPKNYFQMLKKQYVLTVPAVWSEKAQDITLRAAQSAGIGPVKLIKEPEAAALYTLHYMGDKGLDVGDAFVICDAGGGTVDLISYEIMSLQPFELKELVKASGGLAGSLMLNRRFEEYIKNVIGENDFIRIRETSAYSRAMKHFDESIKPGFHTSDDNEQYVNFPKAGLKDRPELGLSKDTIAVKRETLYKIFEPIIIDIERLVSDQIAQARIKRYVEHQSKGQKITAIFLVGGFGANSYLHEKIKAKHPDIRVIQPNDAWSAIVRGAVMYNLPTEASVISNIAPKHYGVTATSSDIDLIEKGKEKPIYFKYSGTWGVDVMIWYIRQGDDMMRARPIKFDFWLEFAENPLDEELQHEVVLMECESIRAPRHPRDDIMKKNCVLKADLSQVPKEYFDKRFRSLHNGDIFHYCELKFELVVTIQSGPMLFSLSCRGKQYGAVTADY